MTVIVKIDSETINTDEFIRYLKLSGQFVSLVDRMVGQRLAVHSARNQGLRVTNEEVQARGDQFRRLHGLHRASDANRYLDSLHVSLDEFEAFLVDGLYQDKVMGQVCGDEAVQTCFHLNSPRFDSVDLSHMVLDGEGKAKEMIALLSDDPDCFEDMAREHSRAASREQGGRIGKVLRGSLRTDVEAKVFHASIGKVVGPFVSTDRSTFEIFRVNARHPARLDEPTRADVRRRLHDDWLKARAQEHLIETL
jgi:peptidylprolyl isomerase